MFTQPWNLVALLLAAFSVLYLAASIHTQDGLRKEFFAGADEGVRQRLAVRIVYDDRYRGTG